MRANTSFPIACQENVNRIPRFGGLWCCGSGSRQKPRAFCPSKESAVADPQRRPGVEKSEKTSPSPSSSLCPSARARAKLFEVFSILSVLGDGSHRGPCAVGAAMVPMYPEPPRGRRGEVRESLWSRGLPGSLAIHSLEGPAKRANGRGAPAGFSRNDLAMCPPTKCRACPGALPWLLQASTCFGADKPRGGTFPNHAPRKKNPRKCVVFRMHGQAHVGERVHLLLSFTFSAPNCKKPKPPTSLVKASRAGGRLLLFFKSKRRTGKLFRLFRPRQVFCREIVH